MVDAIVTGIAAARAIHSGSDGKDSRISIERWM